MSRRFAVTVPRLFALTLGACVLGALALALAPSAALAQGLTVQPVSILLGSGQTTSSLTVTNQTADETSFQVRAFVWSQDGDSDRLDPTDALQVSPPLGTIAPGATQVVRFVLRQPPQGREASYRILLDQIPPPAAPGTVRIALRLSIPIFAEPAARIAPQLRWRIESGGGQASLVATNDGGRHETVRDIELALQGGRAAKVEANASPYILPGVTRRWRIAGPGAALAPGTTPRLTARADAGAIDLPVTVGRSP